MTEEKLTEANQLKRAIHNINRDAAYTIAHILDGIDERYRGVIEEASVKIREIAASETQNLEKKFAEL